jgi:hypothetical protein
VRFIKEVGDVFLSESGCPGFKDFHDYSFCLNQDVQDFRIFRIIFLLNHEDTKDTKEERKRRREIFRYMHHFFTSDS